MVLGTNVGLPPPQALPNIIWGGSGFDLDLPMLNLVLPILNLVLPRLALRFPVLKRDDVRTGSWPQALKSPFWLRQNAHGLFVCPVAPGTFNGRPDPSIRHPGGVCGSENLGCLRALNTSGAFELCLDWSVQNSPRSHQGVVRISPQRNSNFHCFKTSSLPSRM